MWINYTSDDRLICIRHFLFINDEKIQYSIFTADIRKYVIGAFEMLYTKREENPLKKHGTV